MRCSPTGQHVPPRFETQMARFHDALDGHGAAAGHQRRFAPRARDRHRLLPFVRDRATEVGLPLGPGHPNYQSWVLPQSGRHEEYSHGDQRRRCKRSSRRYGDVEVIHGIDLHIDPGEFTVFVGPSGCGKSTLLRMIAGLEPITGGDLLIDGERMNEVPAAKRGIAMVFQSYALYPHMSVYQNLAFGLETARHAQGRDRAARRRRPPTSCRSSRCCKRKPKQLSGGQRQRVAIGRAIVREPRSSCSTSRCRNLDAELRVQMRVEIAKLHNDLGNTMIYVTHDQVEAMTMADKIVVLQAGRHRAGRRAARPLQQPAQPVRRRLHRLAQDEFPRGDGRGQRTPPAPSCGPAAATSSCRARCGGAARATR